VSALSLLFGLALPACSGQQQEEESLEATGQGENNAAGNEEGGGNAAEGGENNAANEEGGGENNAAANEGANEAAADKGNGTENDLQEIIQEMNGQQTTDGAAGGETTDAAALQQNTSAPVANAAPANAAPANPAPVNNTAAAAPAPAANPIPFQPGGSPAAPGLPEMGSKMAYVVEAGDTLAKISQKIYGTNGRWNELATLSGLQNPSRIFPGDLVYYTLDESAVPFATAYESLKKAEEAVQQGDTLATVAKRVYGNSNAWRALWRQNDKIDNPDIVPPGTTIYYLPKGAATAAVKKATDLVKFAKVALTTKKHIGKNVATKKISKTLDKTVSKVSKVAKGIQLAGSQIVNGVTNVSIVAHGAVLC